MKNGGGNEFQMDLGNGDPINGNIVEAIQSLYSSSFLKMI
jgi:hypothetical protein